MNTPRRRRVGLALGWAGTTAVAVALALAAVGAVSDSVTGSRPGPLGAAAVRAALAEGTATTAADSPPATPPSKGPAPAPPTTRTTQAATTSSSRQAPTTQTTTTPSVPSTTVRDDDDDAGDDDDSSEHEERTYDLVGGTVRVRFEDGGAELVAATPKPGFRVERDSADPGEVRVHFRSDDHESRLRAWWDGGPREEIEERER